MGLATILPGSFGADGTNLYLATVIDCCSRRLAGWAIADRPVNSFIQPAGLPINTSTIKVLRRPVESAQYTSQDYATLCTRLGVTLSLGAVGTSADNALAEAFNATLKRETLQGAATWPDEATCRRDIFRWATRNNTRRRHSDCGHQSPNTYEHHLTATLPLAA